MKSRLNSIFFGVCFLASLLAVVYSIVVLEGDIVNTIGFGLVSLIMGYMLFEEIYTNIRHKQEQDNYIRDVFLSEISKLRSGLKDLTNVEKATYSATKKSTEQLTAQLIEVVKRVEMLESNYISALNQVTELQKKALDNQKKATNLEIHYSKENTKDLLHAIEALDGKMITEDKINQILNSLEQKSGSQNERNPLVMQDLAFNDYQYEDEAAITDQWDS